MKFDCARAMFPGFQLLSTICGIQNCYKTGLVMWLQKRDAPCAFHSACKQDVPLAVWCESSPHRVSGDVFLIWAAGSLGICAGHRTLSTPELG
jgi:hypothetical protein